MLTTSTLPLAAQRRLVVTVGSESGDPDAIKSLNGNTTNGAIYNLAGQRVSKAQKGIFIQDGKKVANK